MQHSQSESLNLWVTVYCSLFTALIIIGAYISIPLPIGPVPIVLADFFVMLTGLFLGWKYGLLTVTVYLGLGALGLPVFSGGGSGLVMLFGPTGGFLIGYLLLVVIIGLVTSAAKTSWFLNLIAVLLGNVALYSVGIIWLKITLEMNWATAVGVGLIPFLPGTVIKILVVLAISRRIEPKFKEKYMR